MRQIFILFLLGALISNAQTVSDLESYNLPVDSFLNNPMSKGFEDGGLTYGNNYNAQWDAWTGFAISTMTDKLTPGFGNQYASITGGGHSDSRHYAVGYAFDPAKISSPQSSAVEWQSCRITNNTYGYYSMLNGDAVAKKFGGNTGLDPDFFKLTVRAMLDGKFKADSVEFYLADFRSDRQEEDYIVEEWTELDLRPLGRADSLLFFLSSSDVGAFGMNTPAYFCLDDLTYVSPVTSTKGLVDQITVGPIPCHDYLDISTDVVMSVVILNLEGKQHKKLLVDSSLRLDVSDLTPGCYLLKAVGHGYNETRVFVKK